MGVSQLRREVPEKIEQGQKNTADRIEATAQKTEERIERSFGKAVQQLTNPVVLADRLRHEIKATAEEKIKALPDEKSQRRAVFAKAY